MIVAEKRGEYDLGRTKDAMVATNENGERIAVFIEGAKANKICIAYDEEGKPLVRDDVLKL